MREGLKLLKLGDRLNGHLILAVRPYSDSDTEVCQAVLLALEESISKLEGSSPKYVSCCYNCQTAGEEGFWGKYFDNFLDAAESFTYRPADVPKKVSPEVWMVRVHHEYGVSHCFGRTAEAAAQQLGEYVRENWCLSTMQCSDRTPRPQNTPKFDKERFDQDPEYRANRCAIYFERMSGTQWYTGPELVEVRE